MNKVCLIGRITAKPELRYTPSNVACTSFNIAVNRNFTNAEGKRDADFISCKAWRKTAEIITKFFDKGSQIGIEGRIETGNYDDKDGIKRYTTDVIVEDITFLDKKNIENQSNTQIQEPVQEDPYAAFGEQVSIEDNFLE